MEKNELRIGNFIQRRDWGNGALRWETILELRKDKVDTSGPITVTCEYSDIEPIPLSEEWFWKSGFFKEEHPLIGSGWMFSINKPEFMSFFKEADYWIPTPMYFSKNLKLKYVHQLQNLFFILTGLELEFKK